MHTIFTHPEVKTIPSIKTSMFEKKLYEADQKYRIKLKRLKAYYDTDPLNRSNVELIDCGA